MDAHTLKVLEYQKIISRLTEHCACSLGMARAERLKPRNDAEWIRARLAETAQARVVLQEQGRPPFGGLSNISDLLDRARAGSILDGAELRQVAANARGSRMVGDYFAQGLVEAPELAALAERLGVYDELEDRVERAIDDHGEVRDDASSELVRLRRSEEDLREVMNERLGQILEQATRSGAAREFMIVQRQGRYCIPVVSQYQSRVPGIIHDRSDSGATVFVEPQEIVERGNRLRETMLAINEEIRRILQELSQLVGSFVEGLRADQQTLGVLDFIVAKARLAQEMGATNPHVREDRVFSLRSARHPLLPGEVVPITIWAGEEFSTIIVTGPNTGGKTVALKTAGLLALMAQAGMHVPADAGSEVAVFEEIFADIGDEQSIEQSLSTFSSHMNQIVKIIHRVSAHERRHRKKNVDAPVNALVLLDEIGAGTDPTEGAALGQAIIQRLHDAGCITVVTTHYNDLKAYAYATEGIQNASVEFDVRTLRPTYKLRIGEAGSSNALDIAQRLGLPREITSRAQEALDPESIAFEDLIRQVEGSRRAMDRQQTEAHQARVRAEELERERAEQIEQLERRRDEALQEGYEEALEIVREAEEEARTIITRLQRQPKQSAVTEEGRKRLAELRQKAEQRLDQVKRRRSDREREREEAEAAPEPEALEVHAGDRVYVPSLSRDAEVVRVREGGAVEVRVGSMTVETRVEELEPPHQQVGEEAQEIHRRMQATKSVSFEEEIDIRGTTVDEAIAELSKYLDDAMLAGVSEVRIIHGKGTGALREGIHNYLRGHRYVSDFSLADLGKGGSGATEVRL